MSVVEDRREADQDIEEVFGLVPEFFQRVPDFLMESEWQSFKAIELCGQDGDPQQVQGADRALEVCTGATRCRYCARFHAEAARLFGATGRRSPRPP